MNSEATQSENNMLMIKGRFKSTATNLYGQFMITFNTVQSIETCNAIISSFSNLYDIEPHTEWNIWEEKIADLKWKGNFNKNMTSSLMDSFRGLSENKGSMSMLYEHAYDYNYDELDMILFDMINRLIKDKNLVLESGIQEVTLLEYQKVRADRSKPKESSEQKSLAEEYSLEEGSVILQVKPILAPVSGKPIYEMKIGDKIIIKIIANTDRSNYFIDLMNLRDANEIKPVPAEVIDIRTLPEKNNPLEVLTLIGPGIYGRLIEEEKQVKLRMYDPLVDASIKTKKAGAPAPKIEPDQKDKESKPIFSKSILAMFALFVLILTLFIILIFMSI
ncbi:MAG: hypothetical protein MUD12_08270 [Spirochaetes bacterium]|jgi:hypothetical protein|nr:hypothetical protein [Spirochaetota bacterium]